MGGWGWAGLLLICGLPTVVPQDLDEKWGDWDSVSCYACGLATVDPESDEEGTYGVTPNIGKKMYNHSCDLMDNGVAYMKDSNHGFAYSGQDLDPRTNVRKEPFKREKYLADGTTQECIDVTTFETQTVINENNETVTTEIPTTKCEFQWLEGFDTIKLDPKEYDLSMWLRRCPEDVRSCFKAEGNWDLQRPSFRGCAGAEFPHGTTCRRELQRVGTLPGRPKVDVEVFLCYCTEDGCNKDTITAGAGRPILRLGGLVNSMVWNCLLGVALYIMMD